MATVTNTINLPDGTTPTYAIAEIELIASISVTSHTAAWVTATDVTVLSTARPTVTAGAWTAALTPNDDIDPAGTVYRINEYVDHWRYTHYIDVPTGGGTVHDLLVDAPTAMPSAPLAAHLIDPTAAHTATAVSFTPTGSIAATTVQAAIAEAASETVALITAEAATRAAADTVSAAVRVAWKSRYLIPGAPFQRPAALAAPPTVAVEGSNAIANSRSVLAAATSNYFTLCAGGNFVSDNGLRYSAANVYPQPTLGRQYFRTLVGFDGTDISFHGDSAPGHQYRIGVQEAGQQQMSYIANNSVAGTGGGALIYIHLTFSTAVPRIISIENVSWNLRAIIVGQYDTVWAVPARGPRCIIVGDSYVQSAGAPPTGYSAVDSWVTSFADTLGWQNVWNSGIGGTGYIAVGSNVNFVTRTAADVIAFNPDIVLVYGGRNDFASGAAAVGAAAGTMFAAMRAGLPNALLVAVGPNGSASPTAGTRDTTWGPYEDAIFTATAAYADIQLEMMSSGIFTGTGIAGTPAAGNGTNYIQSDGVHPTTTGASYLGRRIAHKLHTALSLR